MPAKYVRAYSKGQKNDFRDAEAIAEAVQRPTMRFVATKTADQLDLQALHRCGSDWSASVPVSSIRSAPSSWSVGSRCGEGGTSCVPGCQAFSRQVARCCPRAWFTSSRIWPATGVGWMSGSKACRARPLPLRARMPVASG
jgi:hypothetical protein